MIEEMIARARAVERARLGVGPEVIVSLCRYCAAAYADDDTSLGHCGKPACEQARKRYEAELRGEGRSLGGPHKPAVAGSTPAPATPRRKRRAA